jgi:uncharacterized membrane protein (UPF0127 family)
MKRLLAVATSAVLFAQGGAAHAQSREIGFPVTRLTVGINVIEAEIAQNEQAREQGLMYRKSLALNSGMLFDFERPAQKVCMWMKNTDIPLSVAFMDSEGVILNIEDMQPQTLDNHCSAEGKTVRYALEMQLGWFAQKHVKVGDLVKRNDSAGK